VRRFEAAGFRAWPAASVHYDGTWLDPADGGASGEAAEFGQSARSGRCTNLAERIGARRGASRPTGGR
jgi:hypothetical protein